MINYVFIVYLCQLIIVQIMPRRRGGQIPVQCVGEDARELTPAELTRLRYRFLKF